MKKLVFLLIPLLILIIFDSCTDNPTDVEIKSAEKENYASTELYDAYLKKLEVKPLNISFEEYKELRERRRSLSKNVTSIKDVPPPSDWEGDPTRVDLDSYGVNLHLGDDSSLPVPIGFDFTFYDTVRTEIYINSNGNLTFKLFRIADIKLPMAFGTPIIAVLACDFSPEANSESNIYYKLLGSEPDRIFVVTWLNIQEFYGVEPNTFQVKLFETTNKIQSGYNGISVKGHDLDYGGVELAYAYPQEVGVSAVTKVIFAEGSAIRNTDPALDLDGKNICFDPAVDYAFSEGTCADASPSTPAPDPITPAEKIADAGANLETLILEGNIHKKLKKDLEKAIKEIDKSLDQKNWLDGTHLDQKKGKEVFDHLKKAVKELKKFEKDKGTDPDTKYEIEVIIESLISASEEFALTALADIVGKCSTGKCAQELGKAYTELNKAEEEKSKRHWDHAIDRYSKAWEHIQKATKHIT